MAKRRVHRVPHERVKSILYQHGVRSVNQAVEWGQTQSERVIMCRRCIALGDMLDRKGVGDQFPDHCHWREPQCRERKYPLISAKSVEGIVRGKRVLGVEFDRVDQILCALEATDAWYKDLAQWYYPPGWRADPADEIYYPHEGAISLACGLFEGVDGMFLR